MKVSVHDTCDTWPEEGDVYVLMEDYCGDSSVEGVFRTKEAGRAALAALKEKWESKPGGGMSIVFLSLDRQPLLG